MGEKNRAHKRSFLFSPPIFSRLVELQGSETAHAPAYFAATYATNQRSGRQASHPASHPKGSPLGSPPFVFSLMLSMDIPREEAYFLWHIQREE
jgi:hypothetical protein